MVHKSKLLEVAEKHAVDYRTVLSAIAGISVRGRTGERARRAAAEWRTLIAVEEQAGSAA